MLWSDTLRMRAKQVLLPARFSLGPAQGVPLLNSHSVWNLASSQRDFLPLWKRRGMDARPAVRWVTEARWG